MSPEERRLLEQLHGELVAFEHRTREAEHRQRKRAPWYTLTVIVVALGFGAAGALLAHLSLARTLEVTRNGCMTMCCQ